MASAGPGTDRLSPEGGLATLHRQVVRAQAGGRIIWQPRILCWYEDRQFRGEELPAPYAGMNLHQLYRALGCSARLYEFNVCFRREEDPAVRITTRAVNATDTETTIHTPVGQQRAVHRRSPNSPHPITLKWEVSSRAELRVATWREAHATWTWDQEAYDRLLRELGDLGAPTIFLPRMNVQCLYIEKMGVAPGVVAIYEWPELVAAFFEELEACHGRLLDLVCASPIEIINFGENVHAGTLSPELFRRYHLGACQRRCEQLHQAGKFVSSHWDGDVKPLLPFVRDTGLDALEAVTPRPQGDVTLEELREALDEEQFLLDGIPAVYFDVTYPVETLLACARRVIELFAPRLVLGVSDEISSTGEIERLRLVGELVREYNARV